MVRPRSHLPSSAAPEPALDNDDILSEILGRLLPLPYVEQLNFIANGTPNPTGFMRGHRVNTSVLPAPDAQACTPVARSSRTMRVPAAHASRSLRSHPQDSVLISTGMTPLYMYIYV
jgi:hypothetical protein